MSNYPMMKQCPSILQLTWATTMIHHLNIRRQVVEKGISTRVWKHRNTMIRNGTTTTMKIRLILDSIQRTKHCGESGKATTKTTTWIARVRFHREARLENQTSPTPNHAYFAGLKTFLVLEEKLKTTIQDGHQNRQLHVKGIMDFPLLCHLESLSQLKGIE